MKLLLLAHAGATLLMIGVILIIQVVHYPLFDHVGKDVFAAYENAHTELISLVVLPLMLVEAGTAALLVLDRPAQVPLWSAVVGLVLVIIIWGSTFFLQVPQHNILSGGFNQAAYRLLVDSNWIRTLAWAARGGLVLWWFWLLL